MPAEPETNFLSPWNPKPGLTPNQQSGASSSSSLQSGAYVLQAPADLQQPCKAGSGVLVNAWSMLSMQLPTLLLHPTPG